MRSAPSARPFRSWRRLPWLTAMLLVWMAAALPSIAQAANAIEGTLWLPNGDVAPPGGLWIEVQAENQDYPYNHESDWRYIAEGLSAVDYSLLVSSDSGAEWLVGYDCWGCDYIERGYYADGGTTWDPDQATRLAGGNDHPGTDLTLLTGNIITGTVRLPNGDVAPAGGISLDVDAYSASPYAWYGSSIVIAEGLSAASYSLLVLSDAEWIVSYSCRGCADYLQWGYYADSGTTWEYDQATWLAGGIDHPGTDLTLLEGNTIGGTVRLPNGDVAPAGGFSLDVYATIHSGVYKSTFRSSVFIAEGLSGADYRVLVPLDSGSESSVNYGCWSGCADFYLQRGYYADGGTTWDSNQATLLAGGMDHMGTDLTLLTGNTIGGTVRLPNGEVAPAGGFAFYVDAYTHFASYWSSVFIAGGRSAADYSLIFPPDSGAQGIVGYYCWSGCSDYLSEGFYADGGTTWDYDQGTLLPGGVDHSGIDLTLLYSEVLAADFGASGLWAHNGTSWVKRSGWNGGAGGLSAWSGGLAVDFDDKGLWTYDGSGWIRLTTWDAGDDMIGWSGGLAVDFDGKGVWNRNATTWTRLTTWNAEVLASWSGGLAADFGSNGVWSYDGASWRRLSAWNPGNGGLSGWDGGLAVDFDGNGLWSYNGGSWRRLSTWDAGDGGLSAWSDGLAVDFDGLGLWSYDGSNWRRLTTWDAGTGGLSGWSGGLAADFDGKGLWRYGGSSWSKLTGWNAEGVGKADLN